MHRRDFLATLATMPLALALVPVTSRKSLTSRLRRTLDHRAMLGLISGAIYVSRGGLLRLSAECGAPPSWAVSHFEGVPVLTCPHIVGDDDYWVVELANPRRLGIITSIDA